MSEDDLLRAGAEVSRDETRRAREREFQAEREVQARDQAQEDEHLRLIAEGRALLDRFLAVMRQRGNPGLRRSPGLLGRRCWDNWLTPAGESRLISYGLRSRTKAIWEPPDTWLRRYMVYHYEISGGGFLSALDPDGPKELAKRLGAILDKNGVKL